MTNQLIKSSDFLINNDNNLERSLYSAEYMINKNYLSDLAKMSILPTFNIENINFSAEVRLFKLKRLVQNNKQSVLESLTAIYTALGKSGHSLFFVLESNGNETQIYLGVKSKSNNFEGHSAGDLLKATFEGQFPGSSLNAVSNTHLSKIFQNISDNEISESAGVTAVTAIPSISVENRENFMQGMERFIDAAEGKIYQAIILAEAVEEELLQTISRGYEQIYTQISPYAKKTLSYSQQESDNVAETLSNGITKTLAKSIGLTETKGQSTALGINESGQIGESSTKGYGLLSFLGGNSSSTTKGSNSTKSENTSDSNNQTKTSSSALMQNSSTTNGKTIGTSEQNTIEFQNKSAQQMLKKVDKNLERLDEIQAFGGWNFAAYFIGQTPTVSHALGSIYYGLMKGDESSCEASTITTWSHANKSLVLKYLKNLQHPQLKPLAGLDVKIPFITPTTLLSTKEIALTLNLPQHSTSSVSVVETVPFGRSVQYLNNVKCEDKKGIEIGVLRHLWKDFDQKITLDNKQLTQHTLVCGSTGSGKSNTLYTILNNLRQQKIPFLVIEPVKGEYKHVFGNYEDVSVYGTNPKQANLLKLNPFSFPDETHVLEHIDRLIEIFNVCWPMYAAMPVILKKSILEAYQKVGWDLDISENIQSTEIFPNFKDVAIALKEIIQNSAYSEEVKGNYIGSLETRIMSLTDGLNARLFSQDELENDILFDKNVIVDLSRVASSETKSLIMGILVMKLNEYRTSQQIEMNSDLRHVAILEEAHHLLKRTNTSQSMESSNLIGKSVEMVSESIAEMRTYGQGFIIVDQSPSALDISAIRNTNTKIILRLPEEQDRQVVGRSVALKDEQLEEISKLPQGVAIVHQSNWLEPILCKINFFVQDHHKFYYEQKSVNVVKVKDIQQEIVSFLLYVGGRLPIDYIYKNIDFVKKNLHIIADTMTRIEINQLILDYKDKNIKLDAIKDFTRVSKLIVKTLSLEDKLEPLLKNSLNVLDFDNQLNPYVLNQDIILKLEFKHACLKYLTAIDNGYLKAYQVWIDHHKSQTML